MRIHHLHITSIAVCLWVGYLHGQGLQRRDQPYSAGSRGVCAARIAGSRWAASSRQRYEMTAEYGRAGNGWFVGIQGVARSQDAMNYVYDARRGNVVVLDDDLNLIKEFGRLGRGPGELSALLGVTYDTKDLIHVKDSVVYVFDGWAISVFSKNGAFVRNENDFIPRSIIPFWITSIHSIGDEFLFTVDSLAASRNQKRFQVWSVPLQGGSARVLFQIATTPPPTENGVTYYGPSQPRPLSAANSDCIFVSDGEHEWVVRYAVNSRALDTLSLPHHEVEQQEVTLDAAAMNRNISALRAARTGRPPASARIREMKTTGVRRWTGMIVDPDGYLWIEPWQNRPDEEEHASSSIMVYRMNTELGTVVQDSVPAFPIAFGRAGVYYAKNEDPISGEVYLAKYALTGMR